MPSYRVNNPFGASPDPTQQAVAGGVNNMMHAFFGDPNANPVEDAKNQALTEKTTLETEVLKKKQSAADTFYQSIMALPQDQRKEAIAGAAMHYIDQTGDVEGGGKIAQVWAGLTDQPDEMRANASVAAGKAIKPDDSFSLAGQKTIRTRNVQDKVDEEALKEENKLTAAKPQADQALKSMTTDLDSLRENAMKLINHNGLPNIVGVQGKFFNYPGGNAADAEALLTKLKSKTSLTVLQNMRNNSKTGGALGNISDAEGTRLENNLAALDKAQSYKQYKEELMNIVNYVDSAKTRLSDAYYTTYGADQAALPGAAPAAGAFNAPTAPPGMAATAPAAPSAPVAPAGTTPSAAPALPAGVTQEDINFTAQKYKMTPEQVLQKLQQGR